jgi:hypothetical protein
MILTYPIQIFFTLLYHRQYIPQNHVSPTLLFPLPTRRILTIFIQSRVQSGDDSPIVFASISK